LRLLITIIYAKFFITRDFYISIFTLAKFIKLKNVNRKLFSIIYANAISKLKNVNKKLFSIIYANAKS